MTPLRSIAAVLLVLVLLACLAFVAQGVVAGP